MISRSQIKQMYLSNLSAMAADLEKEITPERMAHLIAYLKPKN